MTGLSSTHSEKLKNEFGISNFSQITCHGKTFHGQGMRLVQLTRPELGDLSGVFVEVPVDVSFEVRDQDSVDDVRVQEPSDEDLEEAVSHLVRLARRGKK